MFYDVLTSALSFWDLDGGDILEMLVAVSLIAYIINPDKKDKDGQNSKEESTLS